MHALTYSGHPTACAVGLANLEIIEREHLLGAVAERGRQLLDGLGTLSSLDHVGEVRGIGLLAAIELVADKATKAPFDAAAKAGERVLKACARRGLVTRVRGDILCFAPPFVVTAAQIDRIVQIAGEAIREALGPARSGLSVAQTADAGAQ
jgi:adenosylmethionine-8-amino-7-oxononanoate aminotransferase